MADISIPEYRVSVDQLRPGVFIRLERVNWFSHPFLLNNFKIRSSEQIQVLKELGIDKVICIPEKSDLLPVDSPMEEELFDSEATTVLDELWRIKKDRARRLEEKRRRIAECEEHYVKTLADVSEIMRAISAGSNDAAAMAMDCVKSMVDVFLGDVESTLHLMSVMGQVERMYYHSLNVAVLSMMVGKELGIGASAMVTLGMGALFHDVGKVNIEKKTLRKQGLLTRAEQALIEKHPRFGVDILQKNKDFPPGAIDIVLQHHEHYDGTGYPQGLMGEEINQLARIVTIADVYDNHLNQADPAKSFTPYQALSYMFTQQQAIFDKELLSIFIRCLGIYPPGTVVQLTTGTIGMVIAVNPENQLSPSLVIYDPEIPKKEALLIDLTEERDIKIEKSLRPTQLPTEIYDYLNPRTRISYYVDTNGEG